jgi:AcrR family transcriptional regulator
MAERTSEAADREQVATATLFPGKRARAVRERLLEGMLESCGELGYERTSVEDALRRAGVSRASFYKHFASKEDCFAQAYEEAGEWLYARLLSAAREQPDWRAGLRVALAELLEFCAGRPQIAKALIVEPQAAGGRALERHNLLAQRFADALAEAPSEPAGRPARPAVTAPFLVGAIEALLRSKLMAGEAGRAPEMLPGLMHFAVMQYCGEEAAWEEMASAPLASWKSRRRANLSNGPEPPTFER